MVWHTEDVWLLNWIFRKNDGIRRFIWGDVMWAEYKGVFIMTLKNVCDRGFFQKYIMNFDR